MLTWLRRFLVSFLLLIPAFFFLSGTDAGLQCLIPLCNRLIGGLLTIGSASGSLFSTLHLRDIRYADGIDTVTIETLTLTWEPSRLLNGQIHISAVRGSGVQVLLGESSGETVLPPFSLPGSLLIDMVASEKIAIFSNQREVWTIQTGTINNLSYQGHTLHVPELSLTSEALTIQAKGHLLTSNGYPVQLAVESHLHPASYEPIAAQGAVNGPLNELCIEADIQAPFPAYLSGRLNKLLGATTWQARLEIPEVALTSIHREWPEQRFTKAVLDGQGTLEEYTLHLHAQAGLPHLKGPSDLTADLRGNAGGFQVTTLHLTHGATSFSAKGSLAWTPLLSWQAEINGTHLNPALFLADWPGDFTGALTTSGQITPNGLDASLHMPALHGTLRSFPLSGNGEFHLKGNRLHIPNLILKSGNSSLRLNGKAAETIDLTLHLDSNNLAELWPGTRGAIHVQGRVTGSPEKPKLDFKLSGNNVGIAGKGGGGVQKLIVEAKGLLTRDGVLDASARAERLQFSSFIMDLGRAQLKGSLREHSFEFDGQNKAFSTGFALQGTFKDTLWQGTLSRTHYTSRHFGAWQQRQPTALALSAEKADITPLCLASSASGSLCLNGSWQAPAHSWQLRGTVSSLPLELLRAGASLPWPVSGRLNASLDLTGQQSRILSGKIAAASDGMSLHIPLTAGNPHQIIWKKNVLQASYVDNRLHAVLDSELTDTSIVHAEWACTSSQLSPENILHAPMNGAIQFRLQDLSPLTVLTDQMVHLAGALRGQFTMNGTPAAPILNGQMELANGQAEIPPLGITLSPLQIKMIGDAKGARLLATASSGKGALQAESVLQFSQLTSGPYPIHVSGDAFKAAHLPGLDLDVSPDILLVFGKQRTEAHGTVTIPQARITSIDFNHATAPSDDMIVIDDENPSSTTVPVPLFTDLTVVAGDDVHVDAYGLRGDISGKLAIQGQPGRQLVGNGTLSVHNGSFTVYGKRLKIDLGRLLFTGGPLTNPGVELRSEKKGEKVTTGVLIDGFLQRPEMHFYSSPIMEQSAVVANLLESTAIGGETRQDTGFIGTAASKVGLGGMVPYLQNIKKITMIDEIKLESGDTYDSFSLVFGSWLTPDFYVSYGKDLVKEAGSFNTRYTLGKGFFFLTETGSLHSGGDIKYEFEH